MPIFIVVVWTEILQAKCRKTALPLQLFSGSGRQMDPTEQTSTEKRAQTRRLAVYRRTVTFRRWTFWPIVHWTCWISTNPRIFHWTGASTCAMWRCIPVWTRSVWLCPRICLPFCHLSTSDPIPTFPSEFCLEVFCCCLKWCQNSKVFFYSLFRKLL